MFHLDKKKFAGDILVFIVIEDWLRERITSSNYSESESNMFRDVLTS